MRERAMKAIEAMTEDFVRHDMEKLHKIIDDRLNMLDSFVEKSSYIVTLCRELWLMSFEIDVSIMEAINENSREVHEHLLHDINVLLKNYIKHREGNNVSAVDTPKSPPGSQS